MREAGCSSFVRINSSNIQVRVKEQIITSVWALSRFEKKQLSCSQRAQRIQMEESRTTIVMHCSSCGVNRGTWQMSVR